MARFRLTGLRRGMVTATVVTTLLLSSVSVTGSASGETVTPSCPTVPVSLANDGFESPVLDAKERRAVDGTAISGWIGSGDKGVVTLLADGWSDIDAAVGRQFAQLSGSNARLSQDVATVPGTTLAWALSHRAVNGSASMRVLLGAPGAEGKEQASFSDPATWTRHGGTYKVPDGQTITRITLVPAQGSAPDANLVDALSFGTASCLVLQVTQSPTTPSDVEGIVTQGAAIRNTGGSPTTDAVLGVVLTETAEYVADSANPAGVFGLTPDTLLIRPVGALGIPGVILPNESVVVTWQERILPAASDSVISIPANLTAVDAFNNRTVTPDQITSIVVHPSTDVQIAQQFTPSLVAPLGATSLAFSVSNRGPSDATGVTIAIDLPPDLTPTNGAPNGCVLSTRTVTCTVGALAKDGTRSWQLPLTAPNTNTPVVTRTIGTVRANGSDPSADNNRSIEGLSIAPPTSPTLEANLSPSPVIATAGAISTVAVDVMNVGSTSGAAPLTVSGSFPTGFTPLFVVGVPADGSPAPTCGASPAQCTFPSMAAGASARVEFRGVIDSTLADGTTFAGSIQTSGIGAASITTPVVFSVNAESTLVVDERIVGPMSAGSPITKLVTVVNGGPSMARDSFVFVPLPTEATPIDSPANCTVAYGGYGCSLGDIDAGTFAATSLSFQLPTTGGIIRDGARADTSTPMPNPVIDRYSSSETVGPVSDLVVRLTGVEASTDVGNALTFLVDVTNRGPGDATAVQVITDPRMTGLRFDSALPDRGVWNPNLAMWELPSLAAGSTARLRIESTSVRIGTSALSVFARSENPDIAAIDNTAIAPLDVLANVVPEKSSSSGGWVMPVLLGLAVLLLLAVVVYLVVQWRRNRA